MTGFSCVYITPHACYNSIQETEAGVSNFKASLIHIVSSVQTVQMVAQHHFLLSLLFRNLTKSHFTMGQDDYQETLVLCKTLCQWLLL